MNKSFCAGLAAGAALLLPAPALADDGDLTLRDVYDAGRCIVDRDRMAALRLMQVLPIDGDNADLSSLPAGLAARCASGMTTADSLHFRGALAQALFFRDFGGFGLEPMRGTSLVNLNLPVQDSPSGTPTIDMYRWADCLVRNDAPNAERLMSSRIGSTQETAAVNAMRPFMTACTPAGAELRVQTSDLRSVVAQSAYHSMYRYWTRDLQATRR
ncbi:MAG: hypothetical protein ACXWU2_14570 [Allosphingosinicella sp.]